MVMMVVDAIMVGRFSTRDNLPGRWPCTADVYNGYGFGLNGNARRRRIM